LVCLHCGVNMAQIYDWDEALELSSKLEKYWSLEGDSHGQAVETLCAMAQYPDYISQELWDAVVAGMKYELDQYETYCKIVITPETFTHDVAELEWYGR